VAGFFICAMSTGFIRVMNKNSTGFDPRCSIFTNAANGKNFTLRWVQPNFFVKTKNIVDKLKK
jgi:hypothetical protein